MTLPNVVLLDDEGLAHLVDPPITVLAPLTQGEDEWVQDAVCKKLPARWFVADGMSSYEVRRAKDYCAVCPVFDQCRELSDSIEGMASWAANLAGIWAGELPSERIARRHGRTARQANVVPLRPKQRRNAEEAPHGTTTRYKLGCKCFECSEARRIAFEDWKERSERAGGSTRRMPKHGTHARYQGSKATPKCRCEKCKAAHAAWAREYARRKREEKSS